MAWNRHQNAGAYSQWGAYSGSSCKQSSGHADTAWESPWWECGLCAYWTAKQKNKCGRCGVKKTWATGAARHWSQTTPAKREEGEAVEAMSAARFLFGSPPLSPSTPQVSTESAMQTDADEVHRQLNEIDRALAAIPPESELLRETMDHLTAQKESLKRKLFSARPIVQQVEGCRGAADRAQKRATVAAQARQDAERALELAIATETETQKAATEKQAELAQLEGQLAQQSARAQGNSVERLQASMQQVMDDMQAGTVGDAVVAEAQAMMQTLLAGLTRVSDNTTRPQSVRTSQVGQMLMAGFRPPAATQQPPPIGTDGQQDLPAASQQPAGAAPHQLQQVAPAAPAALAPGAGAASMQD